MVFHRAVIVLEGRNPGSNGPKRAIPHNFSIIDPHRFDLDDVVGPNVVLTAGESLAMAGLRPACRASSSVLSSQAIMRMFPFGIGSMS